MKLPWMLLVVFAGVATAQNTQHDFAVDVANSRIYVVTHRSGVLSFLGHEHAVLANQWNAQVCWDTAQHSGSRARFTVDVATLTIDADSARRIADLGKGPSAGQRTQIHEKMMKAFDSAAHPAFTFVSDSVRARAGGVLVFGRIAIKGTARSIAVPVDVSVANGVTTLSGAARLRQTWFGIKPESIAGVVKVKDEIDLHMRLTGTLTAEPCR